LLIRPSKCLFIALFIFIFSIGYEPLMAQNGTVPAQPLKDVNLDYVDASLTSVLKALAYSYNLNLVITKDITGKVSAQLKNISLDEALDAILSVNGYTFSRKENIIYIVPKSEQEQVTESIALSYLAAKDAKQLLSKAISERGDIQVNEATNSLIIMDDVRRMEKIKALIAEIDVAPIQVLIEARVVDIDSTELEYVGVTANAQYAPAGGGLFSRATKAPESMALQTNLPATNGGQEFYWKTVLKGISTDLTIDALVQKHKARILASPSIATLNGQEARIIIGERYPYTQVTSNSQGNTQSTLFVDVGTTLRVTPQVSPDGWITMKVHPEVSAVFAALAAGPRIDTREADATIRVKDNDTIIIGGLINRKDDRTKEGIPFLKSIPLIGWLFQRHNTDIENAELTVFITPHIIRSPKEAPLLKNDGAHEVFVDTKAVGKDMDILSGLLSYADSLEDDVIKNPPNDLYRNSELIKTYKMIFEEFPHSGKGDYCLYKIVAIYASKFGKCSAAHEALVKLKELYKDSPYIRAADDFFNTCLDEPVLKTEKVAEKTGKNMSL